GQRLEARRDEVLLPLRRHRRQDRRQDGLQPPSGMSMRLGELLQPPALRVDQLIAGEQLEQRKEAAHVAAMQELLAGKGDFWNDCHESIYDAVRQAVADKTLFDEQRWALVRNAIWNEGNRYAAAV